MVVFQKSLFQKKHGPVPKKTAMSIFLYKNTYDEAIFDLRPKREKIYIKIGYSGHDFIGYRVIDPLRPGYGLLPRL